MGQMIRVEGLVRDYGAVRAVDGIDFDVPVGQVLGFMGPNGAGKTTTLRILAGLLAPTRGQVFVAGHRVGAPGDRSRDVMGYLPETAPAYDELTVDGYLRFVARVRGMKPKRAAHEAMQRCDLLEMRRRPVGALSKGYRQRVGLAQAIIHDPEVLILDEPTSGLDPSQRVAMRAVIREVGRTRTVIFSSHVMQEVEAVADRVLIMHRGQIVADDTPAGLTAADGLRLVAHGEGTSLSERLEALPAVRAVEPRVDHLWLDAPADAAPMVARAVVEAGWDLVELRPGQSSLEQAFIRLTSTG